MSSVDHAKEQSLVQSFLYKMGAEGQDRWEACKSSHRFLSFIGKQLIIFTYDKLHRPVLVDRLMMQGLSLTSGSGLTSQWFKSNGTLITVSHTPIEVAPSVFLWHTFDSNLQYVPHKGEFNVKTSMLFKAQHNINYKHVGPHYILESAQYQQEFSL